MKRTLLIIIAFMLSFSLVKAQPVSDMGVIPIGVSLNSILRLNIVKGGNIEFIVSTFKQFDEGIANAPIYDTEFTVASSVDFDVTLYSESDNLTGVGLSGATPNTMAALNVGYLVEATAGAGGADGTNWDLPADIEGIGTAAVAIVAGIAGFAAGDITQNAFTINWELATDGIGNDMLGDAVITKDLLKQNIPSDRYVVNVFLVLKAQ